MTSSTNNDIIDPLPVLDTIDLSALIEDEDLPISITSLPEENRDKRIALFQSNLCNDNENTGVPKTIDLMLTTEEINFLHRLLSYKIDMKTSQTALQVFSQFDEFKKYVYFR